MSVDVIGVSEYVYVFEEKFDLILFLSMNGIFFYVLYNAKR